MSAIEDAYARRAGAKTAGSLSHRLVRPVVKARILTDHFVSTTMAKVRSRLAAAIRSRQVGRLAWWPEARAACAERERRS